MADFEKQLQRPFQEAREKRSTRLNTAQAHLQHVQLTCDTWPRQKQTLKKRVLPRLKVWSKRLKQSLNPKEVRELKRTYARYRRARWWPWFRPKALRWRLKAAAYLTGILTIVLVWISIITCLIWLLLYLTYLLYGWGNAWLT